METHPNHITQAPEERHVESANMPPLRGLGLGVMSPRLTGIAISGFQHSHAYGILSIPRSVGGGIPEASVAQAAQGRYVGSQRCKPMETHPNHIPQA